LTRLIIHKKGKQHVEKYIAFGNYENVPSPLCVGAKMLWKGYSYYVTNYWKDVTCKHCLKMRKIKEKLK